MAFNIEFEQFVETIRFGVTSGAFTIKQVTGYLLCNNWHTTRDVPADRRDKMLQDLIS